MAEEDLRAAPGDATAELRDRPVPRVLQRTFEEPPGVEDVRLDQALHVRISLRKKPAGSLGAARG
jgi:hypothetical protein